MKQTQSAGGVVLNVLNSQILVLVVNQHGRSWSLPKGHIDPGEDAITAATREIYEESGVTDLTLLGELGSYQRYKISLNGGDDMSEEKTIFMFLFTTIQLDLKPIDPENPEAKRIHKNDVADLLTHRKDKDFFLSIIDRIA